jgi:hypothetical protein
VELIEVTYPKRNKDLEPCLYEKWKHYELSQLNKPQTREERLALMKLFVEQEYGTNRS